MHDQIPTSEIRPINVVEEERVVDEDDEDSVPLAWIGQMSLLYSLLSRTRSK